MQSMGCLSCQFHCVSKSLVLGSLPTNNGASPPPLKPKHTNPKHSIPTSGAKTRSRRKKSRPTELQQQLTLIQIERAVGAGSYRDSDTSDLEQRDSILKGLLPNSGGELEGPVEKKLRETGEWIVDKTEGEFRSSGKKFLMFFWKWVLPIYIFMFLVSSGIVKLPLGSPFLEDLLM